MIYTVTLVPALDLILHLHDNCRIGVVNRAYEEHPLSGGKGINVSRVLKTLKRESVALGFVGGFSGKTLEDELHCAGIKTDFAQISNFTRVNVKIVVDGEDTTEINAPSPALSKEDIMGLVKKIAKIKKDDVVVISGAMPKSFPLPLFDDCIKLLENNKTNMVIDMSGTPLLKTLRYKPFLVKINQRELADTLYLSVNNDDDIVRGAKRLLKMGAQNVVITRGKNGAIFVNKSMVMNLKCPKGEVKNTSGAGDSFLAGFIDEYLISESFEKALKKGIIVGSASAFSIDLPDEKTIKEVAKLVK
ncbi:MAG: 1-phosphofructokinase family hexose kinase [Bacilli bacterium]|nr:1-phosphofructokinase family hexose kinase [Bacilli bacterium]